jgi:hypothetical protein
LFDFMLWKMTANLEFIGGLVIIGLMIYSLFDYRFNRMTQMNNDPTQLEIVDLLVDAGRCADDTRFSDFMGRQAWREPERRERIAHALTIVERLLTLEPDAYGDARRYAMEYRHPRRAGTATWPSAIVSGLLTLAASATVPILWGLYIGTFVGWAWWMWMAIVLKSFWMFVFGIAGPTSVAAALLGLWSCLFGVPLWLLHIIT